MPFVFDETRCVAVDPGRNIEVGLASIFLDEKDTLPFYYKSPQLYFTYGVMYKKEYRYVEREKFKGQMPFTLSYAISAESTWMDLSLCKGYSHDDGDYQQILKDIQEGLFVLGTRGGETLADVPDFKVNVFRSWLDIK